MPVLAKARDLRALPHTSQRAGYCQGQLSTAAWGLSFLARWTCASPLCPVFVCQAGLSCRQPAVGGLAAWGSLGFVQGGGCSGPSQTGQKQCRGWGEVILVVHSAFTPRSAGHRIYLPCPEPRDLALEQLWVGLRGLSLPSTPKPVPGSFLPCSHGALIPGGRGSHTFVAQDLTGSNCSVGAEMLGSWVSPHPALPLVPAAAGWTGLAQVGLFSRGGGGAAASSAQHRDPLPPPQFQCPNRPPPGAAAACPYPGTGATRLHGRKCLHLGTRCWLGEGEILQALPGAALGHSPGAEDRGGTQSPARNSGCANGTASPQQLSRPTPCTHPARGRQMERSWWSWLGVPWSSQITAPWDGGLAGTLKVPWDAGRQQPILSHKWTWH